MTSTPRVLAVGIAHSAHRATKVSKATATKAPRGLQAKILAQKSEAKAAGFELELIQVKPSLADARLQQIRDKLKDERPDLFVIGFGIRGSLEHTVLFEQLVNMCREASPETKLGFNTSMEGTVEACRRGLGM